MLGWRITDGLLSNNSLINRAQSGHDSPVLVDSVAASVPELWIRLTGPCPIVINTAPWHWHWHCIRQTNPVALGGAFGLPLWLSRGANKSDGNCWRTRVCQKPAKLTSDDLSVGCVKHNRQFSAILSWLCDHRTADDDDDLEALPLNDYSGTGGNTRADGSSPASAIEVSCPTS